MVETVSSKKFLQAWIWAILIVGLLAVFQTVQRTIELEIILLRSRWILLVGVLALTSLGGLWLLRSILLNRATVWMDKAQTKSIPVLGVLFITVGFLLVWIIRLYVFGDVLPQSMPILWAFLWASLLQIIGLKWMRHSLTWQTAFAIGLLTQGMIYQLWGIFAATSTDPFSMGYSEAGRHYYASLYFSESIYGMKLPFPFLHPSRYILLSIPYLIKGLPLWFHRFWQAFLWFGLTLGASFSLIRRMKLSGWINILLMAWAFLFFLQGAVYYHLQVCVMLILAGVNTKHQGRSLLFITLASIWAGISRVNWFPVPAMLAITLYIMETPLANKGWKYWITPFVWGLVGLACALLAQFFYIQISGNADISGFGSSFTSQLIWSRLLPNASFPLGILPGALLVSVPLFLAFYQMTRGRLPFIHPLRWLALLAMLIMLFIGGVIVSTKIGGGGDLHNMDAYLVMLSVLATAFLANQVAGENDPKPMWGKVSWGVVSAALLIPLGFAIPHIGFYPSYDKAVAQKDIQVLQDAIQNGGEILFITERQLITFHYLKGVRLAPEYEQSELMEMAMSGNKPYLEKYYADLHARRFDLIIAEDQKFTQQKQGAFVEENVAWVRFVGAPLLCNYKPVIALSSNNIQIFEPRPNQVQCKDPFSQ